MQRKIYVASSWKNEKGVLEWAELLRRVGHEVDCFADTSTGRFVFHASENQELLESNAIQFLQNEKTMRAFMEDRDHLDWANTVLLVLPAGNSAHLEAGYCAGQGKDLIIYRDYFPPGEFDVMYGFANLITSSKAVVLKHLEKT